MNTHITRSGNVQRLRLQSVPEASAAGTADARQLIKDMADNPKGIPSADLLFTPIVEIIALASENRFEESQARLTAFCEVIGPILAKACNVTETEGGEL